MIPSKGTPKNAFFLLSTGTLIATFTVALLPPVNAFRLPDSNDNKNNTISQNSDISDNKASDTFNSFEDDKYCKRCN